MMHMTRSRFRLPISRLKLNLLANFAGSGWAGLMQLAFIPLYIRFLGIEAYGLIGFYLTLQAALQILDFGLSPTMNREMARYSVQPERASEARDFVRTLEVGYWALGLLIGAAIAAAAPFIATHWIQAEALPVDTVRQAIVLMAALSVLQWPLTLYQGGLIGLQRQMQLNAIQIGISTLTYGGAVLVVWLISPTLTAFLGWQILTNALRVGLVTMLLWRSLPRSNREPRFDAGLIRRVWRFAAGMSGITVSALVLTQLDKLILSKLLSLELFGYYSLAWVAGNTIALIVNPVFNVVFPGLSALVAVGDTQALTRFYHRSAQLMAVVVAPVAAVLVLFAYDIFGLWTGNALATRNVAPIASFLVFGSTLNSLMVLPYALQLAHGWTGLGLRINIFLIAILVPTVLVLAARYGPVGAAAVWPMLNGLYLLIGAPLTHRRLLKREGRRWLIEDVGLPLAGTIGIAWAGRELVVAAGPLPALGTIFSLGIVWLATFAAAALAANQIRAWAFSQLARVRMIRRAPPA